MFFPERIKSIQKTDKVLEIGPGNTPYYRSDVLLEKVFDDEDIAKLQAGGTDKKDLKKQIVYYSEDRFPFEDDEFDYVICSHVLEHIPLETLSNFISEMQRVSKKGGYIEVPLYSYEVFTNIEHHLSFLSVDEKNRIYFLNKDKDDFENKIYQQVIKLLEESTIKNRIINNNLEYLVSGFEWNGTVDYEIIDDFSSLVEKNSINFRDINISKLKKLKQKIYTFINKNRRKQMLYQRFGVLI